MIKQAQNFYMIGIKGVGMASLSVLLQKLGKKVAGTDLDIVFQTDALLKKHGIRVDVGFDEDIVPKDTDIVVTTGAFGGLKNPPVVAAQERGVTILTHAQALGEVMKLFEHSIAVCGSHGKTTTSALLAFLMVKMNLDVAYQVGVPSFSGLEGGNLLGEKYIVVESDEYAASPGSDNTPRFMYQSPSHILCTNIDYEHVDVYASIDEVQKAFSDFFTKLPSDGALVYSADDPKLVQVANNAPVKAARYSYGMQPENFTYIQNIRNSGEYTQFDLTIDSQACGEFKTALVGDHNVRNIAGALTILYVLGVDIQKAKDVLPLFVGAKRRYELIYEDENFQLIDDYAHHPRELEALIKGAKQANPSCRVLVIFQPHTYSRTVAMQSEFVDALLLADKALLLDIYASAREEDTGTEISSKSIAEEAGNQALEYVEASDLIQRLAEIVQPGDVVITAGATDTYKYHDAIIDLMKGIKV